MVVARTRTPSPRPVRLPAGGPTGSRTTEVLKGIGALALVTLLVVGVPLALYAGFGTPWPDSAPSTDWVYESFTARDVLAVLVVVVWLAWAHFVVCLVVEAVTERRGRGLTPQVPGAGIGTQALARRLVSAVLLLSGGVGVAMPVASAETGGSHADAVAVQDSGAPAGASAVVREPVTARHHHDPPAFTQESAAGAMEKYIEVQPPEGRHYDTLWGIAERYLGDGMRYKEIAALNTGAVQPDGTTLRNPDLIYPGWIMKLPADAEGPGLRVVDQHTAKPERPTHHKPGDTEHGGSRAPAPPGQPPATGGSEAGSSVDVAALTAGGFAVGGALLAAGLLVGLRRERGWDGGPGPKGGKTPDPETDLRDSADLASAVFIDTALRTFAQSRPAGAPVASPTACLVGADGLALTFPAASRIRLQEPWVGDASGRTWTFRRSDIGSVRLAGDPLSPFPGLVALGQNSGSVETLIDVESVPGIVSLSGDLQIARELAVAMGLGLATHPWADSPRVTFVGFADDLTALAPSSIRHYDELETVLASIDATRRRQQSACAAGGYASVVEGRAADPDRRLWAPEFVVLSGVPSEADVARLAAEAADPRSAIGVIVVGEVAGAAVKLLSSPDGRVWCGPLGLDLAARRMTSTTYRQALDLFDEQPVRGSLEAMSTAPAASFDDALLDPSSPQPVEIAVLGRTAVDAPGELDPERREQLTELVVYLALHPDGVHPNVLDAALWPRGVSEAVRDLALAAAAHWLGTDREGTPRLRVTEDGRWLLGRGGVRLDWDVYRVLVNRAASSSTAPGGGALTALSAALALVTGPPLAGLPAHRFGWLAHEPLEADMTVAVVAVARRLAEMAAQADDPVTARNALLAGLRAAPGSEALWRDALRLAVRFATSADVTAVAEDMYDAIRRLGSPRGAEGETDALVDELLPGYRRSAA